MRLLTPPEPDQIQMLIQQHGLRQLAQLIGTTHPTLHRWSLHGVPDQADWRAVVRLMEMTGGQG